MYLIIRYHNKDVARVWQNGNKIEYKMLDSSFETDVQKAIRDSFGLVSEWKGKKVSKISIEQLEEAFKWEDIVKFRGEAVDADGVDEKTGKRWWIRTGIISDRQSTGKDWPKEPSDPRA